MSPKWTILFWMGRKTLINQSVWSFFSPQLFITDIIRVHSSSADLVVCLLTAVSRCFIVSFVVEVSYAEKQQSLSPLTSSSTWIVCCCKSQYFRLQFFDIQHCYTCCTRNVCFSYVHCHSFIVQCRFRIMMLSVLQNTKSPVKFWFLKNYLSPSFKVRDLLLPF